MVFLREKHLLTASILRLLDDRYAALPRPGRDLELILTNMRNRPLSSSSIESMRVSILSLYHNLITGSRDFPMIHYKGNFRSKLTATPFFDDAEQEEKEGITPSGLVEPPAGSIPSLRPILTPPLPEKASLGALKGDFRNCVRHMEVDGRTGTRVISPVYRCASTKLTNRWRVSDYEADGQVLMSALCRFTKESAQCLKTRGRKRKNREEESSSSHLAPAKKCLRL